LLVYVFIIYYINDRQTQRRKLIITKSNVVYVDQCAVHFLIIYKTLKNKFGRKRYLSYDEFIKDALQI